MPPRRNRRLRSSHAQFRVEPTRRVFEGDVAIYHAPPHGLEDGLRRRFEPDLFVDTTSVHARKRNALAAHASQKEWLDRTQGMDSYLAAMDEMSLRLGELSQRFSHAEAWRRHSNIGFGPDGWDPLSDAIGVQAS